MVSGSGVEKVGVESNSIGLMPVQRYLPLMHDNVDLTDVSVETISVRSSLNDYVLAARTSMPS